MSKRRESRQREYAKNLNGNLMVLNRCVSRENMVVGMSESDGKIYLDSISGYRLPDGSFISRNTPTRREA